MPSIEQPQELHFAAQLLLEAAQEHSLEELLRKIVVITAAQPTVVGAQIWMIDKGDACFHCAFRQACRDQSQCLQLAASEFSEGPDSKQILPHFLELQTHLPMGTGIIGAVADTGQQLDLRDFEQSYIEPALAEWLQYEQVCECVTTPITFKGKILGVTITYATQIWPEESLRWSRVFADHIGAVITNTRNFIEIQQLKAKLELQNTYLIEEVDEAKAFGDLVGNSSALRQIISKIDLVARTEATVLILGETGTGKELVARELHRRSPRKHQPLVRVNCASIPQELFESELFGHVKGAFTGAIKDRPGRFGAAQGGTLVLDEIGEISMEMQGKLLRVLQERCYERVGEDQPRYTDVRIISSTNRDLMEDVKAGRFREDLFYRLHVFPIYVAPLRERKDDIPLLVNHFIELSAKDLKCPKPRLTHAAMSNLQLYDWPGNIRELRNVIERAVILANGGALQIDLPLAAAASQAAGNDVQAPTRASAELLTEAEMRHLEYDNLLGVLKQTGWKIKGRDGAAEFLGVKPATLLARMKKMGVVRPG